MSSMPVIALLTLLASSAPAATTIPVTAPPIELARVNGEPVTDRDLKDAFVGKHGGHTVFLGGESETRRFLDIVVNEKLLVQEAYNLGLDSDPSVKPQVDEFRKRKMSEFLLEREIGAGSMATPEEIRAAWELADELFIAHEIVVDDETDAESIRRGVLAGADFALLARACSTSPTRTRGGSLTPFTWGSQPVEVEQAAFALQPGELSPLFRSAAGWHILFLTDRIEAARPELDERVSARIASKLKERKKESLTSVLSERLWRNWSAKFVVMDRTASDLLRLLNSKPETVIVTWNGGQLTAQEAFTPGELRMFAALAPGQGAAKVDATLRAAVNTALIQLEAAALKVDEEPSVAVSVDKFEAKLMEGVLYAQHVLSSVNVTEGEIRSAFDAQKATLVVAEKRRISHIAVATEAEAKALRARITRGEDFQELLKASTLDRPSVTTEGDLGWIEKGKVETIYDPLFTLPLLGVSQPIRSPKAWHVLRVVAIEPEHPLSFEEARAKIEKTLLEKKKHDAREVWIEKLREAGEIELLSNGIKAFVDANPYDDSNK